VVTIRKVSLASPEVSNQTWNSCFAIPATAPSHLQGHKHLLSPRGSICPAINKYCTLGSFRTRDHLPASPYGAWCTCAGEIGDCCDHSDQVRDKPACRMLAANSSPPLLPINQQAQDSSTSKTCPSIPIFQGWH
jgi:hypothetical protein